MASRFHSPPPASSQPARQLDQTVGTLETRPSNRRVRMVGIELFGSYWMAQNRRSRLAFVLLVVLKFKGVLRQVVLAAAAAAPGRVRLLPNPDPGSEVSGQRSEESHDFAQEPPVLQSASARVK